MKMHGNVRRLTVLLVALVMLAVPSLLKADPGPDHQAAQTRPIQLGTSGGNINDASRLFCCTGTLGSLVQNGGGTQFILSNNHVLARTNKASLGEDVIQPGLADQNCVKDLLDVVADLSAFKLISFKAGTTNTVDAAIAQVRAGAVDTSGSILDIGQVSSAIAAPALGTAVKKSGRTTGLTLGTITAVNVTVDVLYSKQCGIGSRKARFVNQIGVTPGTFSAGGDSGSLVVEDVGVCPRAIGLLFAGSSAITLANPISEVLGTFPGTSMAGCPASARQEKSLFQRMMAWFLPRAHAAQQPPVHPAPVDPAAVAAATHAKERHEHALLSIPGVVGVGVGLSDAVPGQAVIEIYVERDTPEVRQALPAHLDNVPVKIVETGAIVAYGPGCGGPACKRCGNAALQKPPFPAPPVPTPH